MNILGVSALYHDSAACLVIDGKIAAAAQEERFTRNKHDLNIPVHAIEYCLKEGKIQKDEIDIICYYDNPLYTMDRLFQNILEAGKDSKDLIKRSIVPFFQKKLWVHKLLDHVLGEREGVKRKYYCCEHHVSHAASAFYPSPFEKAVILTLDGVGEWATTSIGIGNGRNITIKEELKYPHSIGLLYSAFTYFCGFKVNSGDYKFMGLAPYGTPVYEDIIREKMIDIKADGSFRLNLKYFDYQYGRSMISESFEELFGKKREPESRINKREMDIAASVQNVIEDIILRLVRHAKDTYGKDINNLVMAGGVALNCVANGKIKKSKIFENIWIQPAAGDAGGSLGAALYAAYHFTDIPRNVDGENDLQKGSYLGPSYSTSEIEEFLSKRSLPYYRFAKEKLFKTIAKAIINQNVVGIFQGRMEFGPRALGNRSIIADARSEQMQSKINLKIKYRESFRPFAPAVLAEDVNQYFHFEGKSPYMLLVDKVLENRREKFDIQEQLKDSDYDMLEIVRKRRSDISAVTHVDYSARIQTVDREINPYFYEILRELKDQTGYGICVNTSFNVRGEPIVCTLEDAYTCFMRTEMDVLVLEDTVLFKKEQPEWKEDINWSEKYELD